MNCEYGCGREAIFVLKNGKHCCCMNHTQCSAWRLKQSERRKKACNTPEMKKEMARRGKLGRDGLTERIKFLKGR